jgi:hypothetical protein
LAAKGWSFSKAKQFTVNALRAIINICLAIKKLLVHKITDLAKNLAEAARRGKIILVGKLTARPLAAKSPGRL